MAKVEKQDLLSSTENDILHTRKTWVILALLIGGVFLAFLGLRIGGASVWDDAYFSVRYADNLLETGQYTWNVGEAPAYGLTSVFYGGYVLALRLLFTGEASLLLLVSSLLLGPLALYLIARLLLRFSDLSGKFRWHALIFFALTFGFNASQLSIHFTSGMDTTLAMTFIALYLLAIKRFEHNLSSEKSLLIGLLGGLAYLIRPELLLFTVGIPLSLTLFSRRRETKLQGAYMLIFTAFSLVSQAFFTSNIFGSFMPLSYYAKSVHTSGAAMLEAYHFTSWSQFLVFLSINLLPLLAILLAMVLHFRKLWSAFTLVDKTLALCLVGFGAYQLFFVVPVMGYSGRFYYPAWPVLIYLGARSIVVLLALHPQWPQVLKTWTTGKRGLRTVLQATILFILLAVLQRPANVRNTFGKFSINAVYQELGQHNWLSLDKFSALPDELSIASTELGILSAMNPHKIIYDLAGLNDPILAKEGFDPDRLVLEQSPDLIYWPHPDYQEMIFALRENSHFQSDYVLYKASELHSFLSVALRKDSPFFEEMQAILGK